MEAKIIVISPETPNPDLASVLNEMATLPVFKIHLRFPHSSIDETRDFLKLLSPNCAAKAVLHHHHELVLETKLSGIHYTEEFRMGDLAFEKQYPGTISSTFHDPESIDWFLFDYVICSPIFPSISKSGYVPQYDKQEWKEEIEHEELTPAFALGGISAAQIPECIELGFKGVVLHGELWREGVAPIEKLKEILNS